MTTHNPPHPISQTYDTVIFDLGDILCTWSSKTRTSLAPDVMRRIYRSATWFEYEKGRLTEDECYSLVASEFAVSPNAVAEGVHASRAAARSDPDMLTLVRELKQRPGIRIIAMTNISSPDWADLRHCERAEDWVLFDRIFTSSEAGERKPNLGFYRHVLKVTGADPLRTIFVDDKIENVVSARSFGMKGLLFTSIRELGRSLRILLRDPLADGERWLSSHAKRMWSVTDTGVVIEENFGQYLLLETTGESGLVDMIRYPGRSNFFRGKGILTTAVFPDDLDTTSIACTVLSHFSLDTKNAIMDEMLALKNADGIMQTYFDTTRPRIDPVVAVNVLTFFYLNNRGGELRETLDWVYDVLVHRAYEGGTLYYHSGDAFLYFLSRLLRASATVYEHFGELFASRVRERFGIPGDPLALSMRILAAASIGLSDAVDCGRLTALQEEDGGWPLGWFYRNGSSGILTGNQGLTTAMAVAAIRKYREMEGIHVPNLPIASS